MFSLSFEVEGTSLECTYGNTAVLKFMGEWAVCNCIYHTGMDRPVTIFESPEEQEILEDYGWVPIEFRMPTIELIEAYYKHAGFDPQERN